MGLSVAAGLVALIGVVSADLFPDCVNGPVSLCSNTLRIHD